MSTDFSCCDYGVCNRGHGCPAGSIVAQDLLGTEKLPGLMSFDDAQKQWRRSDFQPLFNTENSDGSDRDADEPWLTGRRVVIGAGIFLFSVVGIAMLVLHFYR